MVESDLKNGYLLDTHALIWWWTEPTKLPKYVYEIIADPSQNIVVSSASVWEMATKHRKGKLGEAKAILDNFENLINTNGFNLLDINWQHAHLSGNLPQKHPDPFDRMLVAQSIIEKLILISCDNALKAFTVNLLWQ